MPNQIDSLIAQLDQEKLQAEINAGAIKLRDYQLLVYKLCSDVIRSKNTEPVIASASVGAGKTLMMGAIAKRANDAGLKTLLLAHQMELVDQNAKMIRAMECANAIYCASAGLKKTNRPTIIGSEQSVKNALHTDLKLYAPDIILIDECHRVDIEDLENIEPQTSYGIIIREMQKRCLEVNKRALRIIGFTGSPFRGTQSIIGNFWKREIVDISSDYLVNRGFLVPTVFGMPDVNYDLSEFKSDGAEGAKDFTDSEMRAMQNKILKQSDKTQMIVEDFIRYTKDRGGALITCAGRKHCEQVAQFLPPDSWRIIDGKTKEKDRKQWLEDARNEGVKFVLQIGALTTGVDVPYWDTSILLRKIGSLTLLIQLLGRGMRLYNASKIDHLVLDYSSTIAEMYEIYSNPILDNYEQQRAKREQIADLVCPVCSTLNSRLARRCINLDENKNRCEHFFKFTQCSCGCKNDVTARYCRECDNQLIDPNANLNTTHYTDDDLIDCTGFELTKSKDGSKLVFMYHINGKWVSEVLDPQWNFFGGKFNKLVKEHVANKINHRGIASLRNIDKILQYKEQFRQPIKVTHRVNSKGFNLIHRKIFA